MDAMYVLVLVLCGLAAGLMWVGLYDAWRAYASPQNRVLDQRMRALRQAPHPSVSLQILNNNALSRHAVVDRWLRRIPVLLRLDRLMRQTDVRWDVFDLGMLTALLMLVFGILGGAMHLSAGLLWSAVALVPLFVFLGLLRSRQKHLNAMESQLPDALDLMVRALQSGHAFSSALQITASETKPPVSVQLHQVFDEISLGTSVQWAMTHLAERVASKEIRYFVVAVLIQSETGGNLGDVLKNTATLIRERQKIAGVVRVLSAEGRISAWILSVMPFVLAVLLNVINPEFMALLWKEDLGQTMLGISLGLMALGIVWMSRLVRIKV